MVDDEKIFYNALTVSLKSDYKKISELWKLGSWNKAWNSAKELQQCNPKEEWERLKSFDAKLILQNDLEFPKLLLEIPFPPLGLYIRGNLQNNNNLSIVGTRKATPDGVDTAYEFAKSLAAKKFCIVSGLALGIDAAAHKGASKTGKTIAVLATGVDNPYPSTNRKLAEDILASQGALVSEYPIGSPALPYRFLERNRIVSGLSSAIIVIEAPKRSGSLATARFALEQNREVFVVPGPAAHINYRGSHALIREGARLVSNPEEILEDLGLPTVQKKNSLFENSPEENSILKVLDISGPLLFDEVVELTKLEASTVNKVLSSLTIAERIEETAHGYKII